MSSVRALFGLGACGALAALGCGSGDTAAQPDNTGAGGVAAAGGASAGGQPPGTGGLQDSSGSGGGGGQQPGSGGASGGAGSLPPRQITISGTGYETCAIGPQGRLACWGGTAPLMCAPWVPPTSPVERISGVGPKNDVCALSAAGSVTCYECCGSQPTGLLLTGPVIDLAAGFGYPISLCGVDGQGAATCTPDAPPAGDSFTEISVGAGFACGIVRGTSSVVCFGELDTSCSTPAVDVGQKAAPPGAFVHLSSFYQHTCGIRTDGSVACWGAGKPGDDATMLDCDGKTKLNVGQSSPPAGTFTQISAGWYHTCGVQTDGTVACWGSNEFGQAAPPPGQFAQVAAGFTHSCAMRADRTVACWGSKTAGRSDVPPDFPSAY